jgi:hypothetical protein
MSQFKENIKNSVLERLEQIRAFLKSINQCALCSEPLTLIHEIDNKDSFVKETAYCSQCQLTVREKDHSLH